MDAPRSGAAILKTIESSGVSKTLNSFHAEEQDRPAREKLTEQILEVANSTISEALQAWGTAPNVTLKIIHPGDASDKDKAYIAERTSVARICDDLKQVSSTEAAVVDVLKSAENTNLPNTKSITARDRVVVCHSTSSVVYVTTYSVGKYQGTLKELVAGERENKGADSIDDELRKWMDKTFLLKGMTGEACKAFQAGDIEPGTPFIKEFHDLKERFGSKENVDDYFLLTLVMPNFPVCGHYPFHGKIRISKVDLKNFFQPVLDTVQ
jgi:hypothetical protein